jgi:Tfp pilus assembly protein PilP
MYKKPVCLLLVLACLALAACGKKDDKINSFVNEINSFTDELVKKVESASTPSEGVDEAQKLMDSRKADLREKFNSVKNIGENQVSEETKKKMKDDFYQDGVKVGQLTQKYGSDPAVKAKLSKLTQDFLALFKMEG